MKSISAFMVTLCFASFMMLTSCGKSNNTPTSERDVPDSALTDSIPVSGEEQFQQDEVPEGRTGQLDSTIDSADRKP